MLKKVNWVGWMNGGEGEGERAGDIDFYLYYHGIPITIAGQNQLQGNFFRVLN